VTIVLILRYLIRSIVPQNVEILQPKRRLLSGIYKHAETEGTARTEDANLVTQYYQYTMMTQFANLAK
jgi:hypothetical protein